ncbi:MAG: phosphatidylglycerophosphatase A [Candidatus Thiodiazotropha lotti]|nr:phosphatidylglycerophosphatase A [Candidatus Thiodiazotropha lotti]
MSSEQQYNLPSMANPVHLLAFGFGFGLAPKAPGTFGTLVGIPFYLLMQPLPLVYYLIITAVAFLLGIWICQQTSRDLGVHDHGGIVWDEIVGYLVTMTFAPSGWVWLMIGFILFRFFDIVKPWPIRWVDQRVEGGFGIMVDDLIAGVFAAICLALLNQWEWF